MIEGYKAVFTVIENEKTRDLNIEANRDITDMEIINLMGVLIARISLRNLKRSDESI